jgi:hypothetical protein
VAGAAAGIACSGTDSADEPATGEARSFKMGISSLPRELNAQAYADTFRLADEAGEVVLIQRTPPWKEFLPGGSVSDETANTTAAEIEAAREHGLEVFFAIDPTDGSTGRDRLANLPPSHDGQTFADEDVATAFVAYAEYVALNFKPAYLALGVEMNLYLQGKDEEFESYQAVYLAARDRVRAASPDTRVTVTFQYEDLQSLLPTEDRHLPSWPYLAAFEEDMDVATISTFPSFAFDRAADIPANYYSQLQAFTDLPILVAQAGFSSEANPEGMNSGSEEEQRAFVARLLDEAEELDMLGVIWFAGWDPDYAEGTAYSVFRSIGLLHSDGTEKPAWEVWHESAQRPLREQDADNAVTP